MSLKSATGVSMPNMPKTVGLVHLNCVNRVIKPKMPKTKVNVSCKPKVVSGGVVLHMVSKPKLPKIVLIGLVSLKCLKT